MRNYPKLGNYKPRIYYHSICKMSNSDFVKDITFVFIVISVAIVLFLVCIICYRICQICEPDDPDEVRLGIIAPVVIITDSAIMPIVATATHVKVDYHIMNAEYVEEIKTEEPCEPENMV